MSFKMPIPAQRAMRKLGSDIRNARLRRRISTAIMAARADISLGTLSKVEKGHEGVAVSSYARVLFVLGMVSRLEDLADASHDLTGRYLEEERLPKRIRMPKDSEADDDE